MQSKNNYILGTGLCKAKLNLFCTAILTKAKEIVDLLILQSKIMLCQFGGFLTISEFFHSSLSF